MRAVQRSWRLVDAGSWLLPLAGAAAALPCLRFQPDDLYIYLRVVQNVLSGDGWGFNPGEPVNVASSGGWLLTLITLMRAAGHPDAGVAQVASAFCTMLAIAGAYRLATGLAGHRLAGWTAALALGSDAWVMRWFWSGMETGAAMAVALWGLALLADESGSRLKGWLGALLIAIGPVIRPELALLAICVFAARVADLRRLGPRPALRVAIAGALVAIAWTLFSIRTWGSVIPASVTAKSSLGAANIATLSAALRVIVATGATQVPFAVAALLLSKSWWSTNSPASRQFVARVTWLFVPMLTLAYAFKHVKIYSRYALPATSLLVVLGAASIAVWAMQTGAPALRRRLWTAALAVTIAVNLGLAAFLTVPASRTYARSMHDVVWPLAHRLAREIPPNGTLATHNIGVLGFVTQRRILDLNGLATPEILPFKRDGRELEYLQAHPPDWIVEIAPEPGGLEKSPGRLLLTRDETLIFQKMFPTGPDPMYLTVYRVRGLAP